MDRAPKRTSYFWSRGERSAGHISLFCNQECDAITKISLEVPTPLLLESVDDGIVSRAVLVAVVSIATWW